MGVEPKNVLVAKNGEVIEITKRSMRATSSVPAGDVYIDGTGVGDVGSAVLRDRRHLAEDGIVMAIITLSSENGKPVTDPEIITRGFVYVKEAEALMGELKRVGGFFPFLFPRLPHIRAIGDHRSLSRGVRHEDPDLGQIQML